MRWIGRGVVGWIGAKLRRPATTNYRKHGKQRFYAVAAPDAQLPQALLERIIERSLLPWNAMVC